jgi:hypothetical protein
VELKANRAGAAAGARARAPASARRRAFSFAAVAALLLVAPDAQALDISPTFVDEPPGTMNRQVWDAARQMVIRRAIGDWEALILDDRVVNVTFDFSRAGTDGYLAQWEGGYSLPPGSTTNLYPWTPQVMHRVRFNSDQLLRPGTRMAFVPGSEQPGPDVWDALTVARHELAHMMGFIGDFYRANASDPGSDKWRARVRVNPPEATFDPGGLNVPLESSSDVSHIREAGGYKNDLMNAGLESGQRWEVTPLHTDMLRLAYGYQVVPEPAASTAALLGAAGLLLSRRRRAA